MSDSRAINDLTPDELFKLIQNAIRHVAAEQSQQPLEIAKAEQDNRRLNLLERQVELLVEFQKRGVKVSGGVTGGVFWGLVLWTVLPVFLALFFAMVGGLAFLGVGQ